MGPADAIRDLAEPVLAAADLELWDLEVVPGALRVFVDREGGIDLDRLASATTALSDLLDAHPDVAPAGRYELEVSSPGIERTLRTPDHHRRYLGATVAVKTTAPVDGARRWQGTLVDVADDAISITPSEGAPVPVRIPLDLVSRTRTVVAWGPAPKPGARPARPPRHSQPEDARS